MSEKPHKKLVVWRKAIDFVEMVYKFTDTFPPDERFGLTAQLKRASVSVASNLAEGAARQTSRDKLRFFYMSRGSISELDTQIEISYRLRLISEEQRAAILGRLDEVSRLLNGLIQSRKVPGELKH